MGCAFTQDLERVEHSIIQTACTETLARRFDVTTASLYHASQGTEFEVRMEVESGGTWAHSEAVGSLTWLTVMSTPDIPNAGRVVARHSHNPTARR